MKKVLILDDEKTVIDTLKIILNSYNVDTHGFSDPFKALEDAISNDYNLYITDLHMPLLDGAEFTKKLKAVKPDSRILVITGYNYDRLSTEALNNGALSLVNKPFKINKILGFIT